MMLSFIRDKNPILYKKFITSIALLATLILCNALAFLYIAGETKKAKIEFYNAQEMQLWLDKYHEENIEQTILSLPVLSAKDDIQLKAVEISTILRDGNNVVNITSKDILAKTKDELSGKNISAVFSTTFNNAISTLNKLDANHNLLSIESFVIDTSAALPLVTMSINLYFK